MADCQQTTVVHRARGMPSVDRQSITFPFQKAAQTMNLGTPFSKTCKRCLVVYARLVGIGDVILQFCSVVAETSVTKLLL